MDPREMEALVQRLVQNPHDQDAIARAYESGQQDPRSYAMLLEKVGTATGDPMFASHWLTEAANVWSATLGDAHRAARALMIAIDRDPTQPTPADRLSELYREKGDVKALVALLERRGKALTSLADEDPELRGQLSGIHEELGRLWSEAPLTQPKKAIDNYLRAIDYDGSNQYAIYAVRELYKSSGRFADAVPFFEMEQVLVSDRERKLALYQDEAEVRRSSGDWAGAIQALRSARDVEGGEDAALKQQFASAVLDGIQNRHQVGDADRAEAAQLFLELAEEFPGEHGFSYAACALELDSANDRAVQLAMHYGGELGRELELAPRAAAYIKANPQGGMVSEARELVSRAMEAGAFDESMLQALVPAADAAAPERVKGLLEVAGTLARKGKKNEAAANYREVLALDPANEDAVAFLETYLRQARKYADLRDLLLSAARAADVAEAARASWLREVAGLCESQLRDADGAISAWRELLDAEPSDDNARAQLKRLLERGNRWDDLTALLQREAEQNEDTEARISIEKSIAKIHEQKRRDPVATGEAWARIAALSPDDEGAIATALRHFERAQRPDLAAAVIADNVGSITDDRARAQLFKRLAELREAAGDVAGAGDAYADGASLAKDPALWEAAERAFVQVENWDRAATAIDERARLVAKREERAALLAKEAEYLARAGDEAAAAVQLEEAAELEPANDSYAARLEEQYTAADRVADLAAYLLRRAENLSDVPKRTGLRKRAATLQREKLQDADAARETLQAILADGDDREALSSLADDAEERGEFSEAVDYLHRLEKATADSVTKADVVRREAKLLAERLDEPRAAIEKYELVLSEYDPSNVAALDAIAELYQRLAEPEGTAKTLERRLALTADPEKKLEVAQQLADLYENDLDQPLDAIRALDVVRELDPEDFSSIERVSELAERLEMWPRVAEHLALLIEIEGDEAEVSRMTRRLAEILHDKLGRNDDALAALVAVADAGDEPCRDEYVRLADGLGWKGIVAVKLVEWNSDTPIGPKRNSALRGAFERFVEVGRKADAAGVAKELARSRSADEGIATRLESIAIELRDLDALGVAHDLLVQDLSGADRAGEMVRQAETLQSAGVEPAVALQHGEQALSSVAPDAVEPLLQRLSKLAPAPEQIVDLYERQILRCKAPADRLRALIRAAQVAATNGALERARGFFDIALSGPAQEETLQRLEDAATETDSELGGEKVRRTLAEAMSAGGQGSRDGGRTRAALLRRAAWLAHRELADSEQAFRWLGDGLVAHVDEEGLRALEDLADELGEPKRAEAVLTRALDEVFDGPLVRKLLARRATLRRDRLDDRTGAAADLKRLHDLSPGDVEVMEQLSALYTELEDYRGMVHLFEDQILRGKQPESRLELARKVARLWEEMLADPREAADAWRRVLRMKSGDPEATAGLERAKANMLKRRASQVDTQEVVAVDGPVAPATSSEPTERTAGSDLVATEATSPSGEPASIEPAMGRHDEPASERAPSSLPPEDAAALGVAAIGADEVNAATASLDVAPSASVITAGDVPLAPSGDVAAIEQRAEEASDTDGVSQTPQPGHGSEAGVTASEAVLPEPSQAAARITTDATDEPSTSSASVPPPLPTGAAEAQSSETPTPASAELLGMTPDAPQVTAHEAAVVRSAPPPPLSARPSSPPLPTRPPPPPGTRPPPPPGSARPSAPRPPPPPGTRSPPPPPARASGAPPPPPPRGGKSVPPPLPVLSPPLADEGGDDIDVDESELLTGDEP